MKEIEIEKMKKINRIGIVVMALLVLSTLSVPVFATSLANNTVTKTGKEQINQNLQQAYTVFVLGSDHHIYENKLFATESLVGWIDLGCGLNCFKSKPVSAKIGTSFYVFAIGADDQMYYDSNVYGWWDGWKSLGGDFPIQNPEVISINNKLYVFGVSAVGPKSLYYNIFDGTSWSGWIYLGGYITSDPDVVSNTVCSIVCNTYTYVFVRGGDNAIWYRAYLNGGWSGWTSLGGYVTSNPEAIFSGSNTLYVFARGGDNAIWYRSLFNNWASIGGYSTSDPEPIVHNLNDDLLHVFVKGENNNEYDRVLYKDTTWFDWQFLGGNANTVSNPEALEGYGYNYLLFRGSDNTLWLNNQGLLDWSGWQSFGGVIIADPNVIPGWPVPYIS